MIKLKILLLSFGWLSLAQAQQLRPEVLAAAGSSMSNAANTARLNFTVGEAVIIGQSLPSFSYGQGFHNGALQKVRVTDLNLTEWGIEVWPNPASQMLYLQFSPPAKDDFLAASIWNLLGQPVLGITRLQDSGTQNIEIGSLQAGIYLLQLTTSSGNSATVKFVKAD